MKDKADVALFGQCSLDGVRSLLGVLPSEGTYGYSVSELTKRAGFGNRNRTRKYLRLLLGLQFAFGYTVPLGKDAEGVFTPVYGRTRDGEKFLERLNGYDETKAIYHQIVLRFPTKHRRSS